LLVHAMPLNEGNELLGNKKGKKRGKISPIRFDRKKLKEHADWDWSIKKSNTTGKLNEKAPRKSIPSLGKSRGRMPHRRGAWALRGGENEKKIQKGEDSRNRAKGTKGAQNEGGSTAKKDLKVENLIRSGGGKNRSNWEGLRYAKRGEGVG